MTTSDVTVCIATIPIRAVSLRLTLESVTRQCILPEAIAVAYDHEHTGAAATKNRALAQVTTQWVTFIDDDEYLMPEHIQVLLDAQAQSGADVVYSGHTARTVLMGWTR
jgi:glycosyltransferase involved in cell wall biosynthesis